MWCSSCCRGRQGSWGEADAVVCVLWCDPAVLPLSLGWVLEWPCSALQLPTSPTSRLNISRIHLQCKEPRWALTARAFLVPKHPGGGILECCSFLYGSATKPCSETFCVCFHVFLPSPCSNPGVPARALPAPLHRCCTAATCWETAREWEGKWDTSLSTQPLRIHQNSPSV